MILVLLKIFAAITVVYFAILLLNYLAVLKSVKFYKSQGVSILPGAERFMVCNLLEFAQYAKALATSKVPVRHVYGWIADTYLGNGEAGSFNPAEHPVFLAAFLFGPQLVVNDPDIVQELFVTKNALFDKSGRIAEIFSDLLGNSFLFSKGDAVWKAKR